MYAACANAACANVVKNLATMRLKQNSRKHNIDIHIYSVKHESILKSPAHRLCKDRTWGWALRSHFKFQFKQQPFLKTDIDYCNTSILLVIEHTT